jgi:hypothetical protein
MADQLRDLRDDCVSEGAALVHSTGKPINHSTQRGFSRPFSQLTTCESISRSPRAIRFWIAPFRKQPLPLLSDFCGVGHIAGCLA